MARTRAESLNEELQTRVSSQSETMGQLKEQTTNLNHDVDMLIGVVRTARASGRWEVGDAFSDQIINVCFFVC